MNGLINSLVPAGLILFLVSVLYMLTLRLLKLPLWAGWGNYTPIDPTKVNQLVRLNAAYYMLIAGGVWVTAVITEHFTIFWGIYFLVIGIIYAIRTFVVKREKLQ